METETSQKQYESRHRLTWAARYPLKPGRDVASRRGVLVQIADTAITGEYWVSQEKLAERMGLTARGVRMKLAKLCDEGALRARPRGYKQTTIYTLMRLDEVAKYGDFLPLNGDATSDRNSSSSQIPPPFDRNSSSSQIGLTGTPVPLATGTPVPPKEAIVQEEIREEEAAAAPFSGAPGRFAPPPQRSDAETAAAAHSSMHTKIHPAAKRHVCPECEHTWPKQFGSVCFKCQCNVERANQHEDIDEPEQAVSCPEKTKPKVKLPPGNATLLIALGGRLPESWLQHQDLKTLIARRNFRELSDIVVGIGGFKLPPPEAFFADYDQHLQEHNRGEAELKAMAEAAA